MKFIDEALIYVKAGDGGKGCVSFRREKFVPRGGPDGGDGGKGGDVVIVADKSCNTLLSFKYRQHYVARRGKHGQGGNKTGADAANLVITAPVGTIIKDAHDHSLIADLAAPGDCHVLARGGMGGKGNAWFATATHQTPRFAQEGTKGEERWIKLELKLLADVGVIGLPNVGKSSFIARVTRAKPKIADYPFTTLVPNLGVVQYAPDASFVIADIPGLIPGAHLGAGMGIRFLRHIERTSVLLHILDISAEDYTSAWDDYRLINEELGHYHKELPNRPQVVAINKIDLPRTKERLEEARETFKNKGIEVLVFSAATGEGTKEIINKLAEQIQHTRAARQEE